MADINLTGINLTSGQFKATGSNDVCTDSLGNSTVGLTGLSGATGLVGFAPSLLGEQGITGLVGITGLAPTGIFGETGILGTTGIIGRTGTQGVTGISLGIQVTGQQGTTGLTGPNRLSILFGATTITTDAIVSLIGVTGGNFAITLPAIAADTFGKRYLIFDINGTAATTPFSIRGNGTNKVNGDSGYTVIRAYEVVELIGKDPAGASTAGRTWTRRSTGQGVTGISGFIGPQGTTGTQGNTGLIGNTGI